MPLPDPALLPDDVAVLKQLVVQLLEQLRLRDERLQRKEHHIHLLLKRIYGSSSEKFDPQQGLLFDNQADAEEAAANSPSPPPVARAASKNRDKHGRGRIPDETKREEVVHDLSEAEKAALGGLENLVELPPETSEQLDWRPSTLFVTVHVRKKYARKEQLPESGLTLAEQNVAVARKPPEAIPGGLAGPGLMAQVIVSKGADHLPLHRLEGIFQRQGVRISRQTMDGWWLQTAEFLQPLYALAVRVVLASHVIHTDDTSVKVRDRVPPCGVWNIVFPHDPWPVRHMTRGSHARSRRGSRRPGDQAVPRQAALVDDPTPRNRRVVAPRGGPGAATCRPRKCAWSRAPTRPPNVSPSTTPTLKPKVAAAIRKKASPGFPPQIAVATSTGITLSTRLRIALPIRRGRCRRSRAVRSLQGIVDRAAIRTSPMHQPDLMLAMLARLWRSISVAAERRGRARRQPFVWEAPQDNVLDPAQRAELALRWLVAVLVDDVVVGQDQPHLRLGVHPPRSRRDDAAMDAADGTDHVAAFVLVLERVSRALEQRHVPVRADHHVQLADRRRVHEEADVARMEPVEAAGHDRPGRVAGCRRLHDGRISLPAREVLQVRIPDRPQRPSARRPHVRRWSVRLRFRHHEGPEAPGEVRQRLGCLPVHDAHGVHAAQRGGEEATLGCREARDAAGSPFEHRVRRDTYMERPETCRLLQEADVPRGEVVETGGHDDRGRLTGQCGGLGRQASRTETPKEPGTSSSDATTR